MTHGNAFRKHSVKADVQRVRVGKRCWHFTFSERWGPLLTDEWAEPVGNTPLADEAHPFWDKFEAWQAARPDQSACEASDAALRSVDRLEAKTPDSESQQETLKR